MTAGAAQAAPSTAQAPASITAEVQLQPATDVESLFTAYVKEFGVQKLEAVAVDAAGNFTIRTGEPATTTPETASAMSRSAAPAKPSVKEFADTFGNVTIEGTEGTTGPAKPLASDVVNGQGYAAFAGEDASACSIGWNGFNAAGKAAVITAGHCAADGNAKKTVLTDPTTEPAEGGAGGVLTEDLGTFGFSQFGGANNSPATNPDTNPGNVGTDVAVIDGINPELNQLAKVTDWTTPADPKASGPKVTGVSNAVAGAKICKSGRTTGWTCGTVDEANTIFLVGGHNIEEDPDDVRAVRGFSSADLESAPGDSGGAIISGTKAVGMISAGGSGHVYGVSLTDALKHAKGYTVKIALNAPKVTTTEPIFRSTDVTGTVAGAPAGTTVAVTIDGKTTKTTVDADGNWTVKAPNKFGTFEVTAQATSGFNKSATSKGSIKIIKQTLGTPEFASPAQDGTAEAPVTVITGSGKAGATIELTGDVEGTVVVGPDSTWSFKVSPGLEIGAYTVTAKQTLTDWNDSKTATNKFTVVPAAPAITSPTDGQEFASDQGPDAISGTNIDGATVALDVNGTKLEAVVAGGTWSVSLGAKLATGEYEVTAVQTVNGIESSAGTSAFKVLAAPAPAPTTAPAPAPTTEPAPAPTTEPAPAATPAPSDDELANTGASSSAMLLGAAGGVLLIGGIAFLLFRRRNSVN
ncbi:trypsin-like serine protease [Specibacter sp. AOP5-B1-6]